MSSAILYGAIVVIWAAVLIPRWLRRGDSSSVVDSDSGTGMGMGSDSGAGLAGLDSGSGSGSEEAVVAAEAVSDDAAERTRILGARRRLLYMLLALALGSAILAETGLAAWWVILPPSIMLAGYLALLREASKADAERRGLQQAEETPRARRVETRGASASRVAEAEVAEAEVAEAEVAEAEVAEAEVAEVAPDPDAEVIDITGRVGEDFYDQYADAKLRAVGD